LEVSSVVKESGSIFVAFKMSKCGKEKSLAFRPAPRRDLSFRPHPFRLKIVRETVQQALCLLYLDA
jgi:hypothetical protein